MKIKGIFCYLFTALFVFGIIKSQEERVFEEGQFGKSELRYYKNVPILYLYGTPKEMGLAEGFLLKKQIKELAKNFISSTFEKFSIFRHIKAQRLKKKVELLVKKARKAIPKQFLEEIYAIAEKAEVPPEDIILANLLPEILPRVFCSTFFIGSKRMKDNMPLFGRNLDYPPIGGIERLGLIVVYKEKGKKAVASFTFPGLVGIVTGMNENGLCGATMDVIKGAGRIFFDSPPRFMFYRLLLSECETVDDVEKKIKNQKCLSGGNFMVVDSKGSAFVLESPGDKWVIRRPKNHMVFATNHFCSRQLASPTNCRRYRYIENKEKKIKIFTLKDAFHILRGASQPIINVQAMIFRPSKLEVYFSFGKVPAVFGKFYHITGKTLFKSLVSKNN